MSSGYNPFQGGWGTNYNQQGNWSSGGPNNWANTGGWDAGYSGWPQQNTTYGAGQQGWDTGYQQPSLYQSQAFGSTAGYRNQMAPIYAYSGGQQYYNPDEQQGQQQFAQYAPPTYQGTDWSQLEQWQGDPSFGGYQDPNQSVSDDQYYQGIGESIPTLQQDEMGRYYTGDDWATRIQGAQDDKRAQMIGFLYKNLGREKPGGGVYNQDDIDRVTGAQAWDVGRTLGEGEDYDWYSGEYGSGYGRNFDVRNPGRALREAASSYGLADDAPGWRTNQNLVTALAAQGLLGEQQDWFGGGHRPSYRTEYDQLRSSGIQNLMNVYGYDYDEDLGRYVLRPDVDPFVEDLGAAVDDPYVSTDPAVQDLGDQSGPSDPLNLLSQYPGIQDYDNSGEITITDVVLHGQQELGDQAGVGAGNAGQANRQARRRARRKRQRQRRQARRRSGIASADPSDPSDTSDPFDPYDFRSQYPGIQDYNNSGSINHTDVVLHGQQPPRPGMVRTNDGGWGIPVGDDVQSFPVDAPRASDPYDFRSQYPGIQDYNNSGSINHTDVVLHGQQPQGEIPVYTPSPSDPHDFQSRYPGIQDYDNSGEINNTDVVLHGQQQLGDQADPSGPSDPYNFRSQYPGIQDYNNSGSINHTDVVLHGQQQLGGMADPSGPSDPDDFQSRYPGIQDYDNSGEINNTDFILYGQQQLGGMANGGLVDGYANGGIASLARGGKVRRRDMTPEQRKAARRKVARRRKLKAKAKAKRQRQAAQGLGSPGLWDPSRTSMQRQTEMLSRPKTNPAFQEALKERWSNPRDPANNVSDFIEMGREKLERDRLRREGEIPASPRAFPGWMGNIGGYDEFMSDMIGRPTQPNVTDYITGARHALDQQDLYGSYPLGRPTWGGAAYPEALYEGPSQSQELGWLGQRLRNPPSYNPFNRSASRPNVSDFIREGAWARQNPDNPFAQQILSGEAATHGYGETWHTPQYNTDPTHGTGINPTLPFNVSDFISGGQSVLAHHDPQTGQQRIDYNSPVAPLGWQGTTSWDQYRNNMLNPQNWYESLYPGIQDYDNSGSINLNDVILHDQRTPAPQHAPIKDRRQERDLIRQERGQMVPQQIVPDWSQMQPQQEVSPVQQGSGWGQQQTQPVQQQTQPVQQQPAQNTANPFVGNPLGMNRGGLVGGAIPPINMGRFQSKMNMPVQNGVPEHARAFYKRLTGGL